MHPIQSTLSGREERIARLLKHRCDRRGSKYGPDRKKNGPPVTPKRLLKAIRGSLGVLSLIAKRLQVVPLTVYRALAKPGFEKCVKAFRFEQEGIVDEAEKTMADMVRQREEYGTALKAAAFILKTKGRNKGWRQEVTIQGGENPVRIEHAPGVMSVAALKLPLDVRRALLERMESVTRSRKKVIRTRIAE